MYGVFEFFRSERQTELVEINVCSYIILTNYLDGSIINDIDVYMFETTIKIGESQMNKIQGSVEITYLWKKSSVFPSMKCLILRIMDIVNLKRKDMIC